MTDKSRLKRKINKMPEFILAALEKRSLIDDFNLRPAYQQNDYIGWITRAKREATVQKRLDQMIDELEQGGVYMKMDHPASRKN